MASNSNNKLVTGFVLGSALIGLGLYLFRNQESRNKLNKQFQNSKDYLSSSSKELQSKLKDRTESTRTNLNEAAHNTKSKVEHVLNDTKHNLIEGIDKTSKNLNDTIERLNRAFHAGTAAAKESLRESNGEVITNPEAKPNDDPTVLGKDRYTEMGFGATEDTTVENTSKQLHPKSRNIAQSVGDAGFNFEENVKENIKSKSAGNGNDKNIGQ